MQATPNLRSAKARAGLARLVQELAPGGRLLRTERLRGGLGCRMDRLRIEQGDGSRVDVSLRRFYRRDKYQHPDRAPTEFEVLRLLEKAGIPAPRPLLLDAVGDFFDCPSMVISFLPGAPLFVPDDPEVWTQDLARTLLAIHAITPDRYDLSCVPVKLRDMLREGIEERRDAVAESKEELTREIHAVLDAHLDHIEWPTPTLVHDDYWPGNTVWHRGRLSGVIDWTSAALGDPRLDVAQCRLDTIVSNNVELGDAFVEAYQGLSPERLPALWYFDLYQGLNALFYYERWIDGYHDAGLTHLTAEDAGVRLRTFLRRVLDARQVTNALDGPNAL